MKSTIYLTQISNLHWLWDTIFDFLHDIVRYLHFHYSFHRDRDLNNALNRDWLWDFEVTDNLIRFLNLFDYLEDG